MFSAIFLLFLLAGLGSARELNSPDLPDAAVDLNSSSFDSVLSATIERFALVEFFAHWCPACRNYKPQYEKVARSFNGPDAAHPGLVFMARVDCASTMNTELCDRFSVHRYPLLLWGHPKKFVSGHWKPSEEKTDILSIDDGRTAERLLNWINKQLGSSIGLQDKKSGNENSLLDNNVKDHEQIVQAIYDVEEATAYAFDIILSHKMIKEETRSPLITFLQLLAARHPSRRCRRGSASILVDFGDLWPSVGQTHSSSVLHADQVKNLRICGKDIPRGNWMFCHGSTNETRGFSCGLWVLFHALTVRIGDGESHSTFAAICDFVHNFFICEECRQHFYEMCSKISGTFNTSRELSLWLWSAHNKVNMRLRNEERNSGSGDPKFPKMIWPSKQLCPSCYSSSNGKIGNTTASPSLVFDDNANNWNEEEVYRFLVRYYGKLLVSSLDKDASDIGAIGSVGLLMDPDEDTVATATNAIAVPVGAALGIALASCAFGVLACFWRAHQKNRKKYKKVEIQ